MNFYQMAEAHGKILFFKQALKGIELLIFCLQLTHWEVVNTFWSLHRHWTEDQSRSYLEIQAQFLHLLYPWVFESLGFFFFWDRVSSCISDGLKLTVGNQAGLNLTENSCLHLGLCADHD